MKTSANHHPGIRVSDMERSAQFYIDALGGHWQTSPFVIDGDEAVMVMGGTPNCKFKVCHIGFDEGTVELFEFLEPVAPVAQVGPAEGGLIHFAFHVDNVSEALERVEANGGERYWPEIRDMPLDFQVIYVTDPDGHILELIDISIEELVKRMSESDQAIAPPAS